jgi:hypothetical protein
MARYSKQCPACDHVFHASEVAIGRRSFPCPNCGKELEYAFQYVKSVAIISVLICVAIPVVLDLGGIRAIVTGLIAYPFVFMASTLIVDQIHPPPFKLRGM